MHLASQVYEHGFPRLNVAVEHQAGTFQCHRLARDGHMAFAMSETQGTDAEWIAECQHAMACNEHHHGIRPFDAPIDPANRGKHIGRCEGQAARRGFELMGQDIQQNFRVTVGVDVPVVAVEQLGFERGSIGQVAVVRHDQPERRVHVKRLRLFFAVSIARRGVAHLPHADVTRQGAHVAGAEHVSHHAFGLVHVELAAILRGNASRILPPVLQQQQAVIDQLVDRGIADHAKYSAHYGSTFTSSGGSKVLPASAALSSSGPPADSAQISLLAKGVMPTTNPPTTNSNTALTMPNAAPSTRSTGRMPRRVTSLRTNHDTIPAAKAVATNTSTKATTNLKPSEAPLMGNQAATSAANQRATKKATNQPANDKTSYKKPRHAPIIIDINAINNIAMSTAFMVMAQDQETLG